MPSFDIRDYWASILLLMLLFLIILMILYPYIRYILSLRRSGMSYREIYDYLRFNVIRSSNNLSIEDYLGEDIKDKYVVPKQVEPYVFYCSECNITSVGYEVLCSICGKQMKQPRFNLLKSENNDKQICVLCHNNNCPECNLEMNGDKPCKQECPYCESMYHYHCWVMTMKEFGKCGHCLEEPPPEFEKLISIKKLDEPSKMDNTQLMAKFEAETGKKAIWGNKITNNYLKWKERNYF